MLGADEADVESYMRQIGIPLVFEGIKFDGDNGGLFGFIRAVAAEKREFSAGSVGLHGVADGQEEEGEPIGVERLIRAPDHGEGEVGREGSEASRLFIPEMDRIGVSGSAIAVRDVPVDLH